MYEVSQGELCASKYDQLRKGGGGGREREEKGRDISAVTIEPEIFKI